MKKIISWLLFITCLFTSISAFSELTSQNKLEITATKAFDYDADRWMENKELRAIITILLFLDYSLTVDEDLASSQYTIANTSFVGRMNNYIILAILSKDEKQCLLVTYDPKEFEGEYGIMNKINGGSNAIEAALKIMCNQGYYKNDLDTIKAAYAYLSPD